MKKLAGSTWSANFTTLRTSRRATSGHQAALKLAEKSLQPDSLVPLPAAADAPAQRLRRETFSTQAGALANSNPLSPSWMEDCWANEWAASNNTLWKFIERPSKNPPGHDLPRNARVRLNRL